MNESKKQYIEQHRAALDAHHARQVAAAKAHVDANYMRNPSLTEVSALVGVSPFHFHRIFKRVAGITIKAYTDGLRVAEAKRLMLKGEDLVDVTERLGFAHQSHFTSRFRQLVGTPPARWLKQQRKAA